MSEAGVSKGAASRLKVRNYYAIAGQNDPGYRNPCEFMPQHPFRCLIVGETSAGKTNLAINIIDLCNCFDRVYLFARNLDEPLYRYLQERNSVIASNTLDTLPELEEMQALQDPPEPEEEEDGLSAVLKRAVGGLHDSPGSGDEEEPEPFVPPQCLFLFDDMITASRKENAMITDYFVRSRKCNCSCMYLSQSYFDIPKVIRLQAGYVFLKGIKSTRTLSQIVKDYAIDLDGKKLEALYRDAEKHNEFLMLDLTTRKKEWKYRRGFGTCYRVGP